MSRGWIVVALLLSLGVNVGLVAVGLSRRAAVERVIEGPRERPPSEAFGRRLADRLDLDRERRERFLEIQHRLIDRTREERQGVAELRRELRGELLSPQPDRERIERLLGELGEREAAMNRAFVDNVLETRGALEGPELEAYLRFLDRFAPGGGGPHGERRPGAWRRHAPRDREP